MAGLPPFCWLSKVAMNATVNTRSNSLTNVLSAIKAGLSISVLPCFVGDREPDLIRCLPPVAELDGEVWLIVREDVKQATHIRAFVDCLSAHMNGLRGPHSGRKPTKIESPAVLAALISTASMDIGHLGETVISLWL